MKLSIVFAAAATINAQKNKKNKPDMSKFKNAMAEINMGARSDGNALLIQQQLEFYLAAADLPISDAPKMLSYGCWCQLLGDSRKNGVGEPVDELDQLCKEYQACSRCTAIDNSDEVDADGVPCSWSNARYEIEFDAGDQAFGCTSKTTKSPCGLAQCSCDSDLALKLVENHDLFNKKMSAEHGFEFSDECIAVDPTGSGPGVETTLECCGETPARFPFKASTKRQCCGGKVYATSKSCCNNDALTPIAEC